MISLALHRPFRTALVLGTGLVLSNVRAQVLPRFPPNEVLVRFEPGGAKPARLDSVFTALGLYDGKELFPAGSGRGRPARGGLTAWMKYRLSGELTPAQVADSLNRFPGMTAQPNYLYRPLAASGASVPASAPDDPEWPNQWGPRIIGLAEVWERVRASARDSAVVAVIDLGVDYRHDDLASRMWRNMAELDGRPGLDDDGNGYVDDIIGWDFTDAPDLPGRGDYLDRDADPMDESGHGTNVAGVIAAAINNGLDMAGVAPTARIMALRAGADLVIGGGFLEEDDIAAAMAYAVDNGAHIINMSFGDNVHSALMYDAITYAYERGVVLVAAAGNDCETVGLVYPAAYDETIAVAATSDQDERTFFSCWGENLDLAAPGQNILTLRPGGGTMRNNGTSFAAPHVAGAAAILLSLSPGLTPREVRSMLRAGVVDLGPPGWDEDTGFGRLDLPTLLEVAADPVAEILAPVRPAGADTGIGWSAFVRGAPPVAWSLTYGIGPDPRIWTSLSVGALRTPSDTVRGPFEARSLPDTTYTLRLSVSDALGRTREDRTLLTVDHSPPAFVRQPTLRRRWEDADEQLLLEWTTDDRTMGVLLVWRGAAPTGAPTEELPLEVENVEHLVPLDRQVLGGGSFSLRVRAVNRAGLVAESDIVRGTVEPFTIPRSGFDVIAKLPPGVLMPGTADFNGNGVRELVIKLATRAPYDTVSVFELSPTGEPLYLFDSPARMRPAAAVDIDRDLLADLIGVEEVSLRSRVKIAAQAAVGLPPRNVWWTGENLVAPTIGDADGDGRVDLIALVDTNRAVLRMYESNAPRQLELVAELVSPVSGIEGRFGIWRMVGDVDGDGRPDLVAGTTGGSIVIFPNTGNNAFGVPRVISGTGNAVRVWGGADLTGDGRANFAVLRHIDADRFDLDKKLFRLELYGPDTLPVLTREFTDPRTEGNGFAVGSVGPDGAPALVLAMPPRLYVLTPSVSAAGGFTWYGETTIPSQPAIADLDGSGGPELVIQGTDSILVLWRITGGQPPQPPTNVRVRAYDSVSVEVSWDRVAGLDYRIWMGPDAQHLSRVQLTDPIPPTLLTDLQTGIPVVVALQAVNTAQVDSLGPLSEPVAATPHAGPRVTRASLVGPDRILVEFDRPLAAHETNVGDFAVVLGGRRAVPGSLILDRSGTRVVLTYPPNTVDAANVQGAALSYTVRDTTGARGAGTIGLTLAVEPGKPGIAFALLTEPTVVRVGFTEAVDPASFTPSSVRLSPARQARTIIPAGQQPWAFDIQFDGSLAGAGPFILELNGLRTSAGLGFSAGTVIDDKPRLVQPLRIVAVLQRSSTELWVVTSEPLGRERLTPNDVSITPRISVLELADGPVLETLAVTLDPNTPVGPWETEYRIQIVVRSAAEPVVLEATWQPLGDRPLTGHLRAVEVLSRTTLRLRFDVRIAASGQPDRPIRIEPGLAIADVVIQDTAVTVSLDERTRLGPWGTTYFVHVDGLLSAEGEHLTELFALRLDPPTTLDSVTVFPQPFRPALDGALVLGGLPAGAEVRLYTLDGALVRTLPPTVTGGVTWDGRNEGGAHVVSGVYLYVVESPVGRKMGKIAVVR